MKGYTATSTGRVHFVHLTEGDDLLSCVEAEARRVGILSGIITSGIGSLRKVHYHYIAATSHEPKDVYVQAEGPMELVCLQGIILEGVSHLHGYIKEGAKACHAGHLELGCEVQYLAEISIVEVADMPLGRRAGEFDTVTHFEWLDGRG